MNLERFFKYTAITGVFALLLTPLIVADSLFFPFITGKNFFFRIVVEVIFASWIILAILNQAYRPRWSSLFSVTAIFIGIIALADILGVYPLRSVWSTFERMDGLMTLLHLFAYLIVAVSVLRSEKFWRRFWIFSVGVSIIVGFNALLEYLGVPNEATRGTRVDATLGNAIYLGGYMLFHAFVTLWLLWDLKKRERTGATLWLLSLFAVAGLLQVVAIFLSQTRGSILGLFGGLGIFALSAAIFARRHPIVRKASIGVVGLLIILAGGFFAVKDSSFVENNPTLERLTTISPREGTGEARFILWQIAIDGWKEKPILGWGQESFIDVFNEYYRPELHGEETWFDRPHNVVLNWLVAGGVLGMLSYLLIWAFLLWGIWHRKTDFDVIEKSLLTGLLAAYFFHNLFVFDNVVTYLLFFSLIAFVHVRRKGFQEEDYDSALFGKTHVYIISAAVLATLLVTLYFLNMRPIQTARMLVGGIQNARVQGPNYDPALSLDKFMRSRERGFLGRFEGSLQMALAARDVRRAEGKDSSIALTFLEESKSALEEEVDANPSYSVRPRFFLGLVLNDFEQYEEAIVHLEKAREISPKKQRILTELGHSYFSAGDSERSGEMFREAYRLDTSFDDLRQGAVMVSLRTGDYDEARKILFNDAGELQLTSPELIREAIGSGADEIARMLIEKYMEDNERNPQALVSAAAAYLEMGEDALAIDALERVVETNPGLEPQISPWIEAIERGENPLQESGESS